MGNDSIRYLIVPGWQGSSDDHWQTHWQNSLPNSTRVEQSDWLPNLLIGTPDIASFARNSCAAGHKALYNEHLGGMVPDEVLSPRKMRQDKDAYEATAKLLAEKFRKNFEKYTNMPKEVVEAGPQG